MKYARITVKYGEGLIHDINTILPYYKNIPDKIYVYDFLSEVLDAASRNLEFSRWRNPECCISSEMMVYCPKSLYQEAKNLLAVVKRDYSDLYLLLEHVA